MSRIKLSKGRQSKLLDQIGKKFCFDWSKVAAVSNVCERTLRDWRSEKYNMSYEALLRLQKLAEIPIPRKKNILPEYWSAKDFARQGALRRYQICGNLGTPEGRRKGDITSQRLFRLNPEYARSLGIIMRKDIRKPRPSIELAEFIGIMLGDGGMTNYQINVTFNTKTDNEYGVYIRSLIKRIFNISAPVIKTDSDNANRVVASGANLVEFLTGKGLKTGDKVRNKARIPQWIIHNKNYSIACLRGLVDTDGSFYRYNHKVYKKEYCNFAMCFTNYSRPLLVGVYRILKSLNFNPIMNTKRVYLHRKVDIGRYFSEISTHNRKHLDKYNNYLGNLN